MICKTVTIIFIITNNLSQKYLETAGSKWVKDTSDNVNSKSASLLNLTCHTNDSQMKDASR